MALIILVHHLLPFAFPNYELPLIGTNLSHAVDVFFVLSGFVLSYVYGRDLPFSRDTFKRYFVHRIARILPLAWLTVIVSFAVHKAVVVMGMQMNHPLDTSLRNFIGNLLFLDSNLPGFQSASMKWSVSNEMVAYFLLFPLTYLLAGSSKKLLLLLLCIVCFQILFWEELSQMGRFFSRCAPCFLAGCLLYHFSPMIKNNGINIALFMAGILGFLFLENRFQTIFSFLIVMSGVSNEGSLARIFSSRPMMFLGDISYSLYLLHGIFVIGVAGILRLFPESRETVSLWIVIPMLLSLFTAYLSYRFFENPLRRRIRAISG